MLEILVSQKFVIGRLIARLLKICSRRTLWFPLKYLCSIVYFFLFRRLMQLFLQNVFSEKLSCFGLNLFSVDFMHEIGLTINTRRTILLGQ
jgi:hypothetical protein